MRPATRTHAPAGALVRRDKPGRWAVAARPKWANTLANALFLHYPEGRRSHPTAPRSWCVHIWRERPVRSDEPTLPGLHYEPGQIPTWPVPSERDQRPTGPGRPPSGCVSATAVGANVVLFVSLLGLLSHTGVFSLGGSSSPGASARHPSRTPTPVTGWLQVAPTSVHLGCNDPQKTQFVVLVNSGPQSVSWQANLPFPAGQAGVHVFPHAVQTSARANDAVQVPPHRH